VAVVVVLRSVVMLMTIRCWCVRVSCVVSAGVAVAGRRSRSVSTIGRGGPHRGKLARPSNQCLTNFLVGISGQGPIASRCHLGVQGIIPNKRCTRSRFVLTSPCYGGVVSAMGRFPRRRLAHHTDWSYPARTPRLVVSGHSAWGKRDELGSPILG
jgi:hypothetical protein